MFSLLAYLGQRSRGTIIAISLLLVAVVGFVDNITGPELAFTVFYAIPIALSTWYAGRRIGILISSLSALAWLIADVLPLHPYAYPFVPYWNVLVYFAFFLIVTYSLSALRDSLNMQEEMSRFVVHDLRAPLTNILTGLETFAEVSGDSLDETQQTLLGLTKVSSERMLSLINVLIDIARLENGQFSLNVRTIDISEVIGQALRQVSLWAQSNHITLRMETRADNILSRADADLTQRVLVNLLSNALKFSKAGGEVVVRAALYSEKQVIISVTDFGPGIPREWQSKVFEKFAQVDVQKRGMIGSGLGLAFSKLAVEMQGGRIWLESEEGKGTTFFFTLPVASAG